MPTPPDPWHRNMALFQSLWIGNALSPLERMCIQSFLDHGHAFNLFVYQPLLNVPDGCGCLDAREILGKDRIFTYREGVGKGSHAAFSNVFRYKLLLDRGGWWVDTDVACLRREIPAPPIALARQDALLVNNAVMRFPPGHPAMQFAYDVADSAGQNVQWGQTGPDLITDVVRRFGLDGCLVPSRDYYPVHWTEFEMLVRPGKYDDVAVRSMHATFLHLWNEMFRRSAYDKHCRPPAGSYLRELFDRHGMRDEREPEFDAEYEATESEAVLKLEMRRTNPP
jgi:Alpha 1,4-glycosyltransferase conserved region